MRWTSAAADTVMVTDCCRAGAIACPVIAGVARRGAIFVAAGQDIVTVRAVASAIDDLPGLAERVCFGEAVRILI